MILNQLKINKPDFIIFYPRNLEEYNSQGIGYDYAVDFCKYIMDNYTQVGKIKDVREVRIYKKNEK